MGKIILNLFIILTFLSCQPENVDVPNTGRKIVINSLLETDSLIGANITTSAYIISDTAFHNQFTDITNARALIYENGIFLDSLTYGFTYGYSPNNYHSKRFYPKPGHQYEIKVDAPDKPEATAMTTIPGIVNIERIDTTRVILTNPELGASNIDMVFDVVFTDPANEQNYYLFFTPGNPQYSTFQDPTAEENLYSGSEQLGIAFSDQGFNGMQHHIMLTINGKGIGYPFWDSNLYPPNSKTVLYFKLYSITEDYYNYIQTYILYQQNYNNPLADPSQVFSNVQGGYGIFGGAGVSCDSIIFQ